MKKTFLFLTLLSTVFVLCFSSCTGKKADQVQTQDEEKQIMSLSKNDTIAVKSLMERYFNCLRNKNVDEAISMLYYLDENGIIIPLPDELKKGQRRMLQMHSGLEYKIDYIKFWQETDSEVKYTCILFEKKPGDNRPNEVKFLIRPMRHNDQWYLTMADTPTQNGSSDLFKPKYERK